MKTTKIFVKNACLYSTKLDEFGMHCHLKIFFIAFLKQNTYQSFHRKRSDDMLKKYICLDVCVSCSRSLVSLFRHIPFLFQVFQHGAFPLEIGQSCRRGYVYPPLLEQNSFHSETQNWIIDRFFHVV